MDHKPIIPPAEQVIGQFGMRLPGAKNYLWTAAEARNIPPGEVEHLLRSALTITYAVTPFRLRLGGNDTEGLRVEAGTAIILPAYSRYVIDTRHEPMPGHRMWASFLWMQDSTLEHMTRNRRGVAQIVDPTGVLRDVFGLLIDIVARNVDTERAFWALQHAGQKLIDVLEKAMGLGEGSYRAERNVVGPADPVVARILTYLQSHMADRFSLTDMAAAVFASRSTVAHHFKRVTGQTPMQALRRMRIQETKLLLVQSLSLAVIAQRVGFCDAHHLAREFKRTEGISPSQFRRAAAARDMAPD